MAVRYTQPQGQAKIDPKWGGECHFSYPHLELNSFSTKGDAKLIGLASSANYTNGYGQQGFALIGSGGVSSAAKGLYNTAGDFKYYGTSDFSMLAVVEFDDLSSAAETAIFRAVSSSTGTGIAFDFFPSTKVIRPLIATTGTTGWSGSYDETDSAIVAGVPWVFGMSYTSGSRIVYSGPLGGKITTFTRTAITGTISDSGSTNGPIYIGGMSYADSNTLPFPGKIYALTAWPSVITPDSFERLIDNPWQQYLPEYRYTYVASVGGATTITGSPLTFQWETNSGSFKQKVETTPINWSWFVTSGTVTEKISFTPKIFQWEVTSGSIQAGSATTISTTPVIWQWEQSSASFVTKIQTSPINFQWEVGTTNIKEYVNTTPVIFQWSVTSGSILGTTAIDFNAGAWQWEITTGSIAYIQPAQASGTIGGKKDKHLKQPYYDKGTKYESRIDLEEMPATARVNNDDSNDRPRNTGTSDSDVDGINLGQPGESDRLVSDLLQELKGQVGQATVTEPSQGNIIELQFADEEYDDSMVESLVVSLLLAA